MMDGHAQGAALRRPRPRGPTGRRRDYHARGAAPAQCDPTRDPGAARDRRRDRARLPPVARRCAAASWASTSSSRSRASSSPRCCCARSSGPGRVSLPDFWARRARRILPAALLTVLVCALATVAFVPLTHWQQFFAEMRASTAYVQNWQLAHDAVDYLASANAPVARPALLVAGHRGAVLPRVAGADRGRAGRHARRRPAPRRRLVTLVLATATALSLALLDRATRRPTRPPPTSSPPPARGSSAPARCSRWPRRRIARPPPRAPSLSWVGLAAIAVAARRPTARATPFPGRAALLPVLGALAVIRAGAPELRWAPTRAHAARRPVQLLGDISYSVYLWHWPLIVLAPFVVARATAPACGSRSSSSRILAAGLTKRLVEDPARTSPLLAARPARWTFAAAAAATAAVLAVTVARHARICRARSAPTRSPRSACSPRTRAASAPPRATPRPAVRRTRPCGAGRAHAAAGGQAAQRAVRRDRADRQRHRLRLRRAPSQRAGARSRSSATATPSHWRPALERVGEGPAAGAPSRSRAAAARCRRRAPQLQGRALARCEQWKREVPRVARRATARSAPSSSPSTRRSRDTARGGQGELAAQARCVQPSAWAALPRVGRARRRAARHARRCQGRTPTCVEQAISGHRARRTAAPPPRGCALPPDPAAVAARRARRPRARRRPLALLLRRAALPAGRRRRAGLQGRREPPHRRLRRDACPLPAP